MNNIENTLKNLINRLQTGGQEVNALPQTPLPMSVPKYNPAEGNTGDAGIAIDEGEPAIAIDKDDSEEAGFAVDEGNMDEIAGVMADPPPVLNYEEVKVDRDGDGEDGEDGEDGDDDIEDAELLHYKEKNALNVYIATNIKLTEKIQQDNDKKLQDLARLIKENKSQNIGDKVKKELGKYVPLKEDELEKKHKILNMEKMKIEQEKDKLLQQIYKINMERKRIDDINRSKDDRKDQLLLEKDKEINDLKLEMNLHNKLDEEKAKDEEDNRRMEEDRHMRVLEEDRHMRRMEEKEKTHMRRMDEEENVKKAQIDEKQLNLLQNQVEEIKLLEEQIMNRHNSQKSHKKIKHTPRRRKKKGTTRRRKKKGTTRRRKKKGTTRRRKNKVTPRRRRH